MTTQRIEDAIRKQIRGKEYLVFEEPNITLHPATVDEIHAEGWKLSSTSSKAIVFYKKAKGL